MAIRDSNDEPLIPDIAGITRRVSEELVSSAELQDPYDTVKEQLTRDGIEEPTVEHLLTHIRGLRAVAGVDLVRGLRADQLDSLDERICDVIHRVVNKDLPDHRTPYHNVALWTDAISREHPLEIFTTNYDMLLEQAFETSRVPYFDGFPGVRRPVFNPRAIEDDSFLPRWTRLWKLHGSINWFQSEDQEVFRGAVDEVGIRRVIHPSHLKYQESRRLPYLAMVDRLRTFLSDSNSVLLLCGYSFRDDHINDTIIQGLQYAQTSVAFGLVYGRLEDSSNLIVLAQHRPNLNILASDGGVIGGHRFTWLYRDYEPSLVSDTNPVTWIATDSDAETPVQKAQFHLGDFRVLGHFLQSLIRQV